MSDTETEDPTVDSNQQAGTETAGADSNVDGSANSEDVAVQSAEFQELAGEGSGAPAEIKRINEIKIQVSAELGRKEMAIQELLELRSGAVVELDREIESEVELVAQGVALAKGEVVVVNDKFALRITEVYQNQKLDAG